MSYILNALRRAEQERKPDPLAAPLPMGAAPSAVVNASPSSNAQWPWVMMGIALALGVAGWLLMLLKPAPAAAPAPIVIVTAPAAAPQSLETLTEEPATDEVYDRLDDLVAHEPEASPTEPAPSSEPVSVAAPVVTASTAAPPEYSLKQIKDLPEDGRAAFSDVRVEVHVYDIHPGRRFVRINGQRYLEGDILSNGAQIETINAAGIVFRFHGDRVLLPSGG